MTEEIIAALERKLESAMLESDTAMLDSLLDDNLVFTNHLGQKTTKQMDLEAHRSGVVNIESIGNCDLSITLFEDVAIVTVLSEICGALGETPSTAVLHFTRVWQEKENQEVRLIAVHSSCRPLPG